MFQSLLILLLTSFGIQSIHAHSNHTHSNQTIEQTLSIIKPDAVAAGHIGEIITRLERSGLKIISIHMTTLTSQQASEFYDSLRDKPFFQGLVKYMTSGPIVVITLEGQDAIKKYRALMGPTDPKKALSGTIRSDFGENIEKNAVHGSDSPESAKREINFFKKSNF